MAEECFVCVSKFTKINKQFVCLNPECKLKVCSKCVRTYILNSSAEPHCMECKTALPTSFLVKHFPKTFITGEFRKSRQTIYIEQQTARIGETMEVIQYEKDLNKERKNINDKYDLLKSQLRAKIDELNPKILQRAFAIERKKILKEKGDVKAFDLICEERINENRQKIYKIKDEESKMKNQLTADHRYLNEKTEILLRAITNPASLKSANPQKVGKYLMKCSKPDCEGIVKADTMSCAICETIYCNDCLAVKLDDHTCNKEDVKTAKEILENTKPCPKCATLIYKIDGCDQMWCVSCHTAFSWNSGIIQIGNIHNPHYYQWLNQRKRSELEIRVVGDEACGGILQLKDNSAPYQFVVSLLNVIEPEHFRGMFRFGGYTNDPLDYTPFSLPKPIIDQYKREIGKIIDTNCTLELCNKQITGMISLYANVMDTLNRYYRNNHTNPEQSAYEKTLNRARYEFLMGKINRDKYEKIIYETNTDKQYDDECATLFEMFASCGVNYINTCIEKHNEIAIRVFNMTNKQVKKDSVNYRSNYGYSSSLYYYTSAKYEDYNDEDNMKYSAFVMKLIGSIMTAQKSMKFESTNQKRRARYNEVKLMFYQNLMHQLVAAKEGYKEIMEHGKTIDTQARIDKYQRSINIISDFINILRTFISDETDELVFTFIEDYYSQVRNKSWCDEYHTMVAELKDLCEQTNGLIDYVAQTYNSITEIHNKGTIYFGYALNTHYVCSSPDELVVNDSTASIYDKCIPYEYYLHNQRRRLTEFATPFVVSDEEQRAFNERVKCAKNFEAETNPLFNSDTNCKIREIKSKCSISDRNTVVACCFARFKFNTIINQCGTVIQKGGDYVKFTPDYPTFPFEIDSSQVKAISSPINLWVNSQKFDDIDSWDGLAGYINSRVNLPMIANMSSRYIVTNEIMTAADSMSFFEKFHGNAHSGASTLLWDDLVSFCFVNNFSIVQKDVLNYTFNQGVGSDLFQRVLNEHKDPTISRKLLFGCAESILDRVMWINVNDYLFSNIGALILDVKLFGMCSFVCIEADQKDTTNLLNETRVVERKCHKQVFAKLTGDTVQMDPVYYISRKAYWNDAEKLPAGTYFAVKGAHYISEHSGSKNNVYNKTTLNGCYVKSNLMRIKGTSIEPKMMYAAINIGLKAVKEQNEVLLVDKANYEKLKRKYLA